MNENIYLSPKKATSENSNIGVIVIVVIIILIIIVALISFLGGLLNNTTSTSDNISITPTKITNTHLSPIVTEYTTPTLTPIDTTIPSPTPTGNFVVFYFYKSPIKPMQETDEVYAFNRYTSETNLVPFAIGEYFKGPSTSEKNDGYILPFTLSGSSECGGSTYKYTYTSSTIKLTICKQIDPVQEPGDGYAGSSLKAMSRVLKSITSSLKVASINKVEVYDKSGACYAPDTGLNGCTL